MTAGHYAEGLALLAVALVPVVAASVVWRRRLLPDWTGPVGHLVELVTSLSLVICVAEVLGAVSLFRVWAIVPVLAVIGAIGWRLGFRRTPVATGVPASDPTGHTSPATGDGGEPSRSGPAASLMAVAAVSVVAADWFTRTVDALHHGMTTTDTLWYHLPFAARFVQQGTITPLHYVDSEAVTVFFPASSELVHALGIAFMGSDLLSPLVNLGWGAVALLAAWCVGRPYGVAPISLTGVAVLLCTPGLVATQPGGGYDDIVGIALLLSSAALLVTAADVGGPTRRTGQAAAALAAGLALGTKFTFVAPVAALTVGVWVLARRGQRWREGGTWILLVAVTGSFWYLRNLITVGNPLPSLHLALGPLSLPSPATKTPTSTVSHFLLDGSAWRHFLLPGLRLSFGPAWWAVLALAGAGLVLVAVTGPGRMPRTLAWAGLASGAAFLVTPQYLTILGAPVFFVDNVRYGDPALAFGLVLLPLAPLLRVGKRSWWVGGAFLATIAVTQLDGTIWPIDVLSQRFGYPVGGGDSLVGLAGGIGVLAVGSAIVLLRRARPTWRPPALAVAGLVVALLASGVFLQQSYLRDRYSGAGTPLPALARQVSHARIAVTGGSGQLQYEFYGRDLTNYVQYIGQTEPHHGFGLIDSCALWRRTLNQGHYDYVVTTTGLVTSRQALTEAPTRETVWTGTDPAATLVRRQIITVRNAHVYIGYSLFRIHGALDPGACPGASGGSGVPAPS